MIDFKFKTEMAYIGAATNLLLKVVDEDYEEYEDLMDEFMYFCEVSGSGKRSL